MEEIMMKATTKYIFTAIFFIALVSSCVINDVEDDRRATEPGMYTYAYTTDMLLSQYLFCLDVAVKMDDVLSGIADKTKGDTVDINIPKFKMRYNKDTCALVGSLASAGSNIKVLTGGTSLRAENAHWSVFFRDDKWIDIYRNTGAEFRVEAAGIKIVYDQEVSSTKLSAFLIPGSLRNYYDGNSGNSYFNNMFKFYDGTLSMIMSGSLVEDKKQNVEAVLTSEMNTPTVGIAYLGLTETWELSDNR